MKTPTECAWIDLSVYDDGEVDVSYKLSEAHRPDLVEALRQMADTLEAGEEGPEMAVH